MDARDESLPAPRTNTVVNLVAARLFSGLQLEAKIGRFTLREVVGSGGMGVVYAAHDPAHDRSVAIKIVRLGQLPERQPGLARARLLREARILARLHHPNIVELHESGVHEGNVFLAMEFIEGPTLDVWVSSAPRSWAEIVEIYAAAGDGLAAAHDHGVIHRDFKPQNVLVDRTGCPRIVDFGLARPVDSVGFRAGSDSDVARSLPYTLTGPGLVAGTPAYMAPELLTGASASPSSDLYAFCTALLEALSRNLGGGSGASEPPEAIIDLLTRGISTDPKLRGHDLGALISQLRELARAQERPVIDYASPWPWLVGIVAVLLVIAYMCS